MSINKERFNSVAHREKTARGGKRGASSSLPLPGKGGNTGGRERRIVVSHSKMDTEWEKKQIEESLGEVPR